MKKSVLFFLSLLISYAIPAQNYSVVKDSCAVDSVALVVTNNDSVCSVYIMDSEGFNGLGIFDYAIVSDFDPCAGDTPKDGVLTVFSSKVGKNGDTQLYSPSNDSLIHVFTFYEFYLWAKGYYAFAVRKHCDSTGDIGNWVYSNVVSHFMKCNYSFKLYDENGEVPTDAKITLDGGNCAESFSYTGMYENGSVTFTGISQGTYTQTVKIEGEGANYSLVTLDNDSLSGEFYFRVFAAPVNVKIDTLSSTVIWDAPRNKIIPESYRVYLNDSAAGEVSGEINSYTFGCLQYNKNYTVSVAALYDGGESPASSTTFTSGYLSPVAKGFADYDSTLHHVTLNLYPDTLCTSAKGLREFSVYRNGEFLIAVGYEPGQGSAVYYDENNLTIGEYVYSVKSVWDLSAFGLPDKQGESVAVYDTVQVNISGLSNRNNKSVKLFPNPAKDFITISSHSKIARISIFDQTGKKTIVNKYNGVEKTNISTGNLKNGIYYIEIKQVTGNSVKQKLVILK